MNYILFDDHSWDHLLPLTFTRPVSEIRIGILKIREKWQKLLHAELSTITRDYLGGKYPAHFEDDNILINSALLPTAELVTVIRELPMGTSLANNGRLLFLRAGRHVAQESFNLISHSYNNKEFTGSFRMLERLWHIFSYNGDEMKNDFELITSGRRSSAPGKNINVISPENIFIEEGFRGEHITINASAGPVYLGRGSEIMEGTSVRGPFAMCEGAIVKMGAKIYGPTTLGPMVKAGGEINNSVILGYSNKSHDGYLGNSVIGEWCNLGANTNNSNLKNNYSIVKLWSYPDKALVPTGLQFCGLIMGDHSKCGINTMFNTGTVVGVNANIFGSGYPDNFIPSFSWGGPQGFTTFSPAKAIEVAERMMAQRNVVLDEKDKAILMHIYETEKTSGEKDEERELPEVNVV